jgi:hypothetical protein
MTALDANNDGAISPEEMENAVAALKKLDANGDGKVSREELGLPGGRAGMRGRIGGAPDRVFISRFMRFDQDGDGKVSEDELPEPMRDIIRRADGNADGCVDSDELAKMRNVEPGMWDPGAPKEDVGAATASHREIDPLPVAFKTLSCLRIRADGNLLAGDSGSEEIKIVSPAGELVASIEPGFGPEAINLAADGTIYCGGNGQLARIRADGQVLKTVPLPENVQSETTPRRRATSRPVGVSGIAISDGAVFVAFGSGWSLGSKSKLFRFDLMDVKANQIRVLEKKAP